MIIKEDLVFKNPFYIIEKNWIIRCTQLLRMLRQMGFPGSNRAWALLDWLIMREIAKGRPWFAMAGHVSTNMKFQIRTTNSQYDSIFRGDYRFGYEPEITIITSIFGSENELFIDVGSNWGYHSINAALMFDMQVIALEANPICANDFECNVKQLGLDAKLKVVKEIVSNQDGQLLTLKLTTSKSGMGSVEESFTKKLLGQSRIKRRSFEYVCTSVTLDSLGLKPKIIKIDTEGHDLKVIEGSLNTIEKSHPIIIMEWSNDLVHERPGPIIEALLNMSYRSFLTSSGQGKLLLREIDLEQLLRNFQFKVSNISGNIVFVHKMDFARFTESPKVAGFSEHRAF